LENSHQFEKPDLSYLMQLMDNNTEIVLEVLAIFKNEVPKDMANLEKYLQQEDWEMLGKTAHKLKSSVGNLGLNELRDLFLFIEQNGKEFTNLDKLPQYVKKTLDGIQQLFIDIEVEIAKLNNLN
jgi:HPt (histidine-containing phosphotransfer) domain-containing protein